MLRRQFLSLSAATAGALCLPVSSSAAPLSKSRVLIATSRTLEINGKAARVYGLVNENGKPGLDFGPNERFDVKLKNALSEETIVHWHGLTPPIEQDGVADNPLPPLKGGEERAFNFPIARHGTYWMHAHTLQEQNLLAAPLIVRSRIDLKLDQQEVVVMLHDFSFTPAEELLKTLTGVQGMRDMPHGALDHGTMPQSGMDGMANMDMTSAMDVNDLEYDAYLANDRTLDDPEVVSVEKGGKVRLRIINGASSTAFHISTGMLEAQAIALDGQPIKPVFGRTFPLGMGQRIDLVVKVPSYGGAFPILARREGAFEQTGIVLATVGATVGKLSSVAETKNQIVNPYEANYRAANPLAVRKASKTLNFHLMGSMSPYKWTMMREEALALKSGERVEISMMNMSMMAHPMHLHGHHFQIVAVDGKRFFGAVRDTVVVLPMQSVTIAFDAGTPGKWAFHCHHLYHMFSGMMDHIEIAA